MVQMHTFISAAVLLVFAPNLHVEAGTCPSECRCDGTKLAVSCIGRNLTEVPAVDEVRNQNDASSRNTVSTDFSALRSR